MQPHGNNNNRQHNSAQQSATTSNNNKRQRPSTTVGNDIDNARWQPTNTNNYTKREHGAINRRRVGNAKIQ
eukprot:7257585-Lingulodinium_polyedra.AAC.1